MANNTKLKFYTRAEIAEMFAVSIKTVDRWIAKGAIKPVLKLEGTRTVRIPHGAITRLVGKCK